MYLDTFQCVYSLTSVRMYPDWNIQNILEFGTDGILNIPDKTTAQVKFFIEIQCLPLLAIKSAAVIDCELSTERDNPTDDLAVFV
jgi:hypothetical protein